MVVRLLGIDAQQLEFRPLPAAGARRCCRVDEVAGAGESWIVRSGTRRTVMPLLDVATEARLTARAAAAGLAPAVAGHDPDSGVLITARVRSARPWTPAVARRAENIDRIAAVIGAVHSLEFELPPFEPATLAARYIELGGDAAASETRLTGELRRLAGDYERSFEPIAVCHNDLVADNVLDAGRLWLIDFEYATRAHPVVDLAGLAAMCGYGAAQRTALLDAYYGGRVPFGQREFSAVVRMLELLAFFWSLACGAGSDEARRYAHLAGGRAGG